MATTNPHLPVETQCPICHAIENIEVSASGFAQWHAGKNIQDALPELTNVQREQLLSGTCGPCWIDFFNMVPKQHHGQALLELRGWTN